jgi:hypothetical protein
LANSGADLFSSHPRTDTFTVAADILLKLNEKMVAGKPEFSSSSAMKGE